MARVVKSSRKVDAKTAKVQADIFAFLESKRTADDATKVMKTLQPGIVEWLKESEPDDNGNFTYSFTTPIAGYSRLNLVRAVKTKVDEDAVLRIAKAHPDETLLKVVTVPDEDAIARAALEGRLSEQEMAEMFPQSETYRLMTPKN